jgi:signal transduction histidine kinase/DNA-binding response OmpR family regulator
MTLKALVFFPLKFIWFVILNPMKNLVAKPKLQHNYPFGILLYFSFLFFIAIPNSSKGQTKSRDNDSLTQALNSEIKMLFEGSEDLDNKLLLLETSLDSLFGKDSIKSAFYLNTFKKLVDNSNQIKLKLRHTSQKVKSFTRAGKYALALETLEDGTRALNESKKNVSVFEYDSLLFKINHSKGVTNGLKGDISTSLEIHYALIDQVTEANRNTPSNYWNTCLFNNYYSICRNYLFENDSLSQIYSEKSLGYAIKSGRNLDIYKAFNMRYYSFYFSNNGPLLNQIADSCIHYALILENKNYQGESFMHKCNALIEMNLIERAAVFCEKADKIFIEIADPRIRVSNLNNIANVFMKVNAIDKALPYYERSYELAKQIKEPKEYLTSLQNLAEKNAMISNHEISNKYYKEYSDSLESYHAYLLKTGFSEAEAKFQTSQKEKEIAIQALELEKKQNTQNKIIAGAAVLLALLGGIYQWYYSRQKIKKKEAEKALELKQQETKKLKELDEMKSQFFTNVSHELRTPLTLISGPLQNAIPKIKDKTAKEDIRLAHSNSKKLLSLINEILDLSKLEGGELGLQNSTIKLNSTINRIFTSFDSLAGLRDILLEYQSTIQEDVYCSIDLKKFEKIINNLVSNAIKFSNHNSSVILKTGFENGILELSVHDSGEGIQENELEKIFDRFYQTKNVKATVGGGTGVGLALTKEYIELMGGKIEVVSKIEEGSSFIIRLPLEFVEPSSEEIIKEGIADEEGEIHYTPILIDGEKPSILVVEDNEDMSNYIKQILSDYYKCSFAIDGFEAIKMIQKEKFDLISSDVMMPRMNGFQLKEKINVFDKLNQIPFIFLTARALEEDKLIGLNLGVDDYITKPFNENEYRVRIHNLLKNKKEREKFITENQGLFDSGEVDSSDITTLKKAEKIVIKNISNPLFKIKDLATDMSYSQRQLTRIIKKLTGLPPVGFILELRLQRAYHLMKSKQYHTVSEVRYEVGIESASYFTNKFKKRFGLNPTDILTH